MKARLPDMKSFAHSSVGTTLLCVCVCGGGVERPFDERTKPSPPLTLLSSSSSSSLPCGVNPAKRRQHQPIYTSRMQFFFNAAPSPLLVLLPSLPPNTRVHAHTHAHTPLCSLWVGLSVFVCTVAALCRPWNNICYRKGERRSSPRLAAPAKHMLLRFHGNPAHPSSCWLYRLSLTSFQSLYCVNKNWHSSTFLFRHVDVLGCAY